MAIPAREPDGAVACVRAWADGLRPEPALTVSEWADEHRILSARTSPAPGKWRTSRTPYLREIMDALSPWHPARRVVFMKGSGVGATEAGNCWIGYIIHHAPAPTLFVMPTVDDARKESKARLVPMLDDCPALRERVVAPRSREAGNTLLVKEFPGGILMMIGANSASGLRARHVRNLFCDEVDQYPGDVDGQGDPVSLAEVRTTSFGSRAKIFVTSTPTVRGVSRIEREFLQTDQRRFFVPCPECGEFDWIRWERVRWEEGRPESAHLVCLSCGSLLDEWQRVAMIQKGEWRATAEGDGKSIGFHLSGLYSPWRTMADHVTTWLRVKNDPFRLKTFVNTVFGETWEEREGGAEPHVLAKRLEEHERGTVPDGVGVLVAAVDVQVDRLEWQVKGFGPGEESWLIDYGKIYGDPESDGPWHALDALLLKSVPHVSGQRMQIEVVTVDSNFHSDRVYQFCKVRGARRVYPVRGGSLTGRPGVSKPTRNNRYRTLLFTLCTDTLKERVYSRLSVGTPGPGYCHLPNWVDVDYLEQLTAEKCVWRFPRGRAPFRVWTKVRERNEALDLEVYCVAALDILGQAWTRTLPERAAALSMRMDAEQGAAPAKPTRQIPRRRWVDGWR